MKKFLLTTSVLAVMGTPVFAADPVDVDTTYDWSGAYIGLNAGYGFGGDDRVGIEFSNGVFLPKVGQIDVSGAFGGVQAGWNFQFDSFVFGVEGDVQFAGIDDEFSSSVNIPGFGVVDFEGRTEIDFFGTARLRGGWAIDRLLIYGTGGLAWANVEYDGLGSISATGLNGSLSNDDIELGFAIGGGAEFAIDESWSVKAEYLFIGLGHENLTGPVLDRDGDPIGITSATKLTPSFHMARIGVNWQF